MWRRSHPLPRAKSCPGPRSANHHQRPTAGRPAGGSLRLAGASLRPAFTFVELMLGLAMMAMVMGAAASLLFAVSTSWQASESAQSLQIAARQSKAAVERLVRSAPYVGLATADGQVVGASNVASPGASLMLWKEDTNSDGVIQVGECAVIQHDPAARTLQLHQMPSLAGAVSRTTCAATDLLTTNSAQQLAQLPESQVSIIGQNVTAASFRLVPAATGGKPSVEFQLTLQSGDLRRTESGTVAVRAASTPGGN